MKVRIRAKARQDLDAILDYTVAEHGEAHGEDYVSQIGAALDQLGAYPLLGEAADIKSGVRSYPVGEHCIYYLVLADRLSVLRVLHKRMDAARHL